MDLFKFTKIAVMVCMMTLATQAQANHDIYSIPGAQGRNLSTGEQIVDNLMGRYVDRVLVSVDGRQNFSEIEVWADGELVGKLGIPGHDPVYPVIVRKNVRELRLTVNGRVKINSVSVYTQGFGSDATGAYYGKYPKANLDSNYGIATTVLQIVETWQREIPGDLFFNNVIRPLRKSAMHLAASAAARPETSNKTELKASGLASVIKSVERYLEDLSNSNKYSNDVLALETILEKIDYKYE